jgi:membrane protein DedA with SNARE-associated domain
MLLDRLAHLSAGWVYLIVGALVFAEDALLIGFLLPGETAAVIGGATASTGHTSLPVVMAVVVVAAIVGDTVGYEIGARYGVRLLGLGPLAHRRERLDRARFFLAERGGPAVFLGRFVAFLRATMPFLAGSAHMRYRTFLAYNAAGGIVWGIACALVGYLAGAAYQRVAARFGEIAAIAVVAIALIAWAVVHFRRRRG